MSLIVMTILSNAFYMSLLLQLSILIIYFLFFASFFEVIICYKKNNLYKCFKRYKIPPYLVISKAIFIAVSLTFIPYASNTVTVIKLPPATPTATIPKVIGSTFVTPLCHCLVQCMGD